MKTILILLAMSLSSAIVNQQFAELYFDKKVVKFPDTKEGVLLKEYVRFTNTGKAPLILENYKVSCPCTQLVLPKDPIPPGGRDSLLLTFDTKGKSYYQDREIVIFTNTRKKTETLRVKVKVI